MLEEPVSAAVRLVTPKLPAVLNDAFNAANVGICPTTASPRKFFQSLRNLALRGTSLTSSNVKIHSLSVSDSGNWEDTTPKSPLFKPQIQTRQRTLLIILRRENVKTLPLLDHERNVPVPGRHIPQSMLQGAPWVVRIPVYLALLLVVRMSQKSMATRVFLVPLAPTQWPMLAMVTRARQPTAHQE